MKKVVLFFIILLVSLEIIVRIPYHQDKLEKILNILEQDSLFFWRHKPNLDILFEGCAVKINSQGLRAKREYSLMKGKNVIRIVCLGASPTFGWGVNLEDTYSQQLEGMLRNNYGQKNFEVINAGILGYSSYQGLLFLKNRILRYSPDIITVAYVINDVDRYRFFRSNGRPDKELSFLNPATIFLKNIYRKSRLYNLMEKWFVKLENKIKLIAGASSDVDLPEARVSAQDYQRNLEEIIRIAKNDGIKIVFIKMPVNLPAPPYVPGVAKGEAKKHISSAINSIKSNKYQEAISELKEAIVLNPYSPEAYFYQGLSYGKIKKYDLAKRAQEKAKSLEAFRCRLDSERYNKIMEDVAIRYGVPLVDIVSAFGAQEAKGLFIDSKLDPIHPNNLGHRMIAEEIFMVLKQRQSYLQIDCK